MGFPSGDVTVPLILPCVVCEKTLGATTKVASTRANKHAALKNILKSLIFRLLVFPRNQSSMATAH